MNAKHPESRSAEGPTSFLERIAHRVAVLDPSGTTLHVTDRAEQITREAGVVYAPGRPLWTWFDDAESGDRVREAIGRAAAGETVRCTVRDGSGPTDYVIRPVPDGSGSVTVLLLEAYDHSELEQIERELRRSHENGPGLATAERRIAAVQQLLARSANTLGTSLDIDATFDNVARLAANFISDCSVIFDASREGVVIRAAVAASDPRHESLLSEFRGRPVDPQSPHPVNDVMRSGRAALLRDVAAEITPDRLGEDDMRILRELPVSTAIIVPLVARGRTSGAIALYRTSPMRRFDQDDLAMAQELAGPSSLAVDNARLYQAATKAIQARDDILTVVSHDLGNPMSAIRVGVSNMLRRAPADAAQIPGWDQIGGIRKSVEHMERLIRDLLDVKRIEAGHFELDWRSLRPANIASSVVEMYAGIAQSMSIRLRSRVSATLPSIRADRERIIQALSNLVGNALKFAERGGTVDISAELADRFVRFSVTDDGPGIDPADIAQIFDRFWRADRKAGGRDGLGLGLAIVKSIVEAHGGRAWAESTQGAGATIRFTVPLARQPHQ